jgi:hypothetical protein
MDASAFLFDSEIVLLARRSVAFARRYSSSETNGRQHRHGHALRRDSGRGLHIADAFFVSAVISTGWLFALLVFFKWFGT